MEKLTTKWFRKWSRKANLSDERLLQSVSDLEKGFSTADLGGHLFKIRVKRDDSGKRSGYRTVIAFRENDRAIFLYGFGKNEKGNIDKKELHYLKKLARDLLTLSSSQVNKAIEEKVLFDLEDSK